MYFRERAEYIGVIVREYGRCRCQSCSWDHDIEFTFEDYFSWGSCDKCENDASMTVTSRHGTIFLCKVHGVSVKARKRYVGKMRGIELDYAICLLANSVPQNEIFGQCSCCGYGCAIYNTNMVCVICCCRVAQAVKATKRSVCTLQKSKLSLINLAGLLLRDVCLHMYVVWAKNNDFWWDTLTMKVLC